MKRVFSGLLALLFGCSEGEGVTPPGQAEVGIDPAASSTITLTEPAADRLQAIMSENELPSSTFVRVSVKLEGPTGYMYDLKFDGDADPRADVFHPTRGLTVVADRKSMVYLDGTEIDFETDGPEGTGFRFHNPNAVEE